MIQKSQPNPYSVTFSAFLNNLKEPRRTSKGNMKYPLIEILFLVVTANICGDTDYTAIEEFGDYNLDWLRKFYPYKNGICSHDVIGKLFQKLDYDSFNDCIINWSKQEYSLTSEEVIAIDGKRIKGSYDNGSGTLATHVVTAFASSQQICIGQIATEQKSNEITAIPQLLGSIDIKGAVISIDAMGCQKEIAEKIISKDADYLLAVKDNQKILHEDIIDLFASSLPTSTFSTIETGHGRVEKRTATVIENLDTMIENEGWKSLRSIVKIDTERTNKLTQKTTFETRHYICSLKNNSAEKMNHLVRQHWAIENKLHWHLDVNFGEDNARKRIGNSAKNMNIVHKIALTLLQRDKESKKSIKSKKRKALFNLIYREKIMKV